MKCKIKSIKIKFKDTEIEGNLDELRDLKDELDKLFNSGTMIFPCVHVYPTPPVYPQYTPYYTWSNGSGTIDC